MLFHLRDTKRFEFYFDVVLFDVFQRLYVTSCFFLPYDISTFLQSFRIVKETAWHKLNKSFPWYKWVQSWVHYHKWFDNSVYLTDMHLVISEPWRALPLLPISLNWDKRYKTDVQNPDPNALKTDINLI